MKILPAYLNISNAATYLGVSRDYIYELIAGKHLTLYVLPPRRRKVVKREDLDKLALPEFLALK